MVRLLKCLAKSGVCPNTHHAALQADDPELEIIRQQRARQLMSQYGGQQVAGTLLSAAALQAGWLTDWLALLREELERGVAWTQRPGSSR